jgi:hypothetical protein
MSRTYFENIPNLDYVSRYGGEKNLTDYVQVKNFFKRGKLRDDIFGDLNYFTKYKIKGDERPDNIAYKIYGDENLAWVVLLSNNVLNVQSEWPLPQESYHNYLLQKYGSEENFYGIHHYETNEIKNTSGITLIKKGTIIDPRWKTNGNFIEVRKSFIRNIISGDGVNPSTTVTVTMRDLLPNIRVGAQVQVNGIRSSGYDGRFLVSSVVNNRTFTYSVDTAPTIATPTLTGVEEVNFTLSNTSTRGNSYFFEYYDDNLEEMVQVPSTAITREVTNIEYEDKIQEAKTNIFLLKPTYLNVFYNDLDEFMPYKQGSTQYLSETLKRGDNVRLYS